MKKKTSEVEKAHEYFLMALRWDRGEKVPKKFRSFSSRAVAEKLIDAAVRAAKAAK